MTREDKRAYNYARDRLANEDYPVYSDEYELKLAYKAGIEDAKNHPHWISVDDEEPPKGQWIITYEPTSPIVIGTDIILSDETADEHHITHWMPLPSVEHLKDKEL